MVSAELFGRMELLIRRHPRRQAASRFTSGNRPRPFGGINVLLFGDFWQLKPIGGTCLLANPRSTTLPLAKHGMDLVWRDSPHSIRRCWELKTPMRCKDKWYNAFLDQCRFGKLESDMHRLVHGYPTTLPMKFLDAQIDIKRDDCTCPFEMNNLKQYKGALYFQPWADRFLQGASGEEFMAEECRACQDLRKARARILNPKLAWLEANKVWDPPFDRALALYAFNIPR